MAMIEPQTNEDGEVVSLKVSGTPIEMAAKMLDIEADNSLPIEMRAQATFMRLVGPAFAEGLDAVVTKTQDPAEVFINMGTLLSQLAGAALLGRLSGAPKAIRHMLALKIATGFGTALMAQVEAHDDEPTTEH